MGAKLSIAEAEKSELEQDRREGPFVRRIIGVDMASQVMSTF